MRILAATNKDLEREVREGRFREDLFYRLNVLPVRVPTLRERREDIPLFVEHYMNVFAAEMHRPVPVLDEEAARLLVQYDWPGNVRELKNVLQRLAFESDRVIGVAQVQTALGRRVRGTGAEEGFLVALPGEQAPLSWRQMERTVRERYFRYVREHSTSDADAAKKLGLAPPNYHRMCKELGIK